jgi:hypothetical protein
MLSDSFSIFILINIASIEGLTPLFAFGSIKEVKWFKIKNKQINEKSDCDNDVKNLNLCRKKINNL